MSSLTVEQKEALKQAKNTRDLATTVKTILKTNGFDEAADWVQKETECSLKKKSIGLKYVSPREVPGQREDAD